MDNQSIIKKVNNQNELHLWIYDMNKMLNTSEFIFTINSQPMLNPNISNPDSTLYPNLNVTLI
jgi:fibronectin type 3 domain-containing protein